MKRGLLFKGKMFFLLIFIFSEVTVLPKSFARLNSHLRRIRTSVEIVLPAEKRLAEAVRYLRAFEIPEWRDFIKKLSETELVIVGPEIGMFDLLNPSSVKRKYLRREKINIVPQPLSMGTYRPKTGKSFLEKGPS